MKAGNEDLLIQRVARAVPARRDAAANFGLALGIGDDATILASDKGKEWLVSCDAFIEGVHFLPDVHPPDSVGYKALVRATSDLAAMGAAPRLFLLTLSLPAKRTGGWLDEFLRGLARAARYLGMLLAGGDTTTGALIGISVTVLGQLDLRSPAVTRSGACPGDRIYVSGRLGRAQLGLELVRKGYAKKPSLARILRPHFYPHVRVELGRWLCHSRTASAMIDLSDGLSSDLARLCRASGVGARISTDRIPAVSLSPELSRLLPHRTTPLQMALHGGDDYELLFTVSPRKEKRLRAAPDFRALTCIGQITRDRHVLLVNARDHAQPLTAGGWDPFR
jgi:thiamine-monophosphate kinase